MPEQGDKSTPSFDPRPPEQRRVAGEDSGVDRPRRRRSRSAEDSPAAGGGSFMGRITGRNELERAKAKRYDPYGYESNNTQLKWVVFALLVWTAIALALAWQDRATANVLGDLRDRGVATVPPSQPTPTKILEFAERERMNCTSEVDIVTQIPECERIVGIQKEYGDVKDTALVYFVFLIAVLLANMFAFGSFTHRASRNLLTLKSKGQRFAPERAVFWFFIPVMNLIRPWQVFKELFQGSDPAVSINENLEWKKKGGVPAIVHVWAAIFVAVFVFNSQTLQRIWFPLRETIDQGIRAHQALIIADILLAVLGVAAIFVAIELNRRQEARHAMVGNITVTPPPPVDPLEQALKEGIRRKELENRRSRSQK